MDVFHQTKHNKTHIQLRKCPLSMSKKGNEMRVLTNAVTCSQVNFFRGNAMQVNFVLLFHVVEI